MVLKQKEREIERERENALLTFEWRRKMRNKSKKIGGVVYASPSILKPEDQLCVRLMNEFLTVYVCQRRELVRVASYLCAKEEESIEGRFVRGVLTRQCSVVFIGTKYIRGKKRVRRRKSSRIFFCFLRSRLQ